MTHKYIKLQKRSRSCGARVKSEWLVRPSVRICVTYREPLNGFSWNLALYKLNEKLSDACVFFNNLKIYIKALKTLLHVSLIRSSSGSILRSLLKLYFKNTRWFRPRRRWVDNIRMDLQEVGRGYVDWIGLAQDRDSWRTLVSAVMNLRVPWNGGNYLTSCKPVSCIGRTLHRAVTK